MTHGSLFSGIGGFDLAAEWMGWENKFHCEWNEFGQRVLNYYWPNAISYGDITKTDFTIWRGRIDVLTGGFPCQPYSNAGKRKGTEDSRHLWPEMLRAIREIQPIYIVGENVIGLTNWNGGLVFEEVQADLEAQSYAIQPVIFPACGKDAPHRRDRVWFIAQRIDSDTDSIRLEGRLHTEQKKRIVSTHNATTFDALLFRNTWENFPTESPVCNGNDGLPAELDGITVSNWRKESVKAGGNAIVPQVAYEIFKAIAEIENNSNSQHQFRK